jgi:hypothetical protein
MRRIAVAAVSLLTAVPLFAANGVIPIWEPTTITEPGRYVAIRNLVEASPGVGAVLVIQADDVDIDLNGFSVSAQSFGGRTAALGGEDLIIASGVSGLRIHDGAILSSEDTIWLDNVTHFAIRRLVVRQIIGVGNPASISVSGSDGVVEDNEAESFSIQGDRIHVRDNRGGHLTLSGSACEISDNLMGDGITVYGDTSTGNLVLNNVVSGSGVRIDGRRNHIEGNTITDSVVFGLHFTDLSLDNVYRGNTARGNNGTGCTGTSSGGDLCDEGTGNTSHGDNYMPNEI